MGSQVTLCSLTDKVAVFHKQQLFHQMGRDGVPLDEVSNLMSRISYPKGRRQHARKKPSQTHVLVSDIDARMQGQLWETREILHLPKDDIGRTQLHPFARHALGY